jgi:membrane-bound lytic murein transglycosylase A
VSITRRSRVALLRAGLLLACGAAVACRAPLRPAPPPAAALVRVDALPPLVDDGDRGALAAALRASVAYYRRLPPQQGIPFAATVVAAERMATALEAFAAVLAANPPPESLAAEIQRRFVVYRASADDGVLFTGYYLPLVPARAEPDARFRFPVLGRPPDLVTASLQDFAVACSPGERLAGRVANGRLLPYFSRAEIAAGATPAAPVLAWVEDPVAFFFLQIQGAGTLLFPDGTRRTIGYAASNGHPYLSIGKLLIDEGRLTPEAASMQGIRRWIAEHPDERERVLNANPRYVFFRPLAAAVPGSLGVPVTAGRTIATDPAIYPPGALAFVRIAGTDPHLARLVLNQDTGAAIRGPGRVDVFFGSGSDAEAIAGRLRHRGELFFLAPRT